MADKSFKKLSKVIDKHKKEQQEDKYISREFQQYGYELAQQLNDMKHKSLYIKLAKETPRGLLEAALRFVSDSGARNPAALFMWKLKKLKSESKQKNDKLNS